MTEQGGLLSGPVGMTAPEEARKLSSRASLASCNLAVIREVPAPIGGRGLFSFAESLPWMWKFSSWTARDSTVCLMFWILPSGSPPRTERALPAVEWLRGLKPGWSRAQVAMGLILNANGRDRNRPRPSTGSKSRRPRECGRAGVAMQFPEQ